ncbi:hypothetical protein [Wolbachia endosymbiont (group A) of Agelastica alni]|uniref:hypothetical protein n=1 Tax=Wolbachia endosymbiont (group A) of Agelastica alni TaxID=3066130 RepID=UPI0031333835
MPNTETVRALINAFNVHNYNRNTVETNFTLQSRYGENYIVVSFDKGMGRYQCSRYLDSIKRKIVGEFYGIEEGDTDEVVLNTANLIFNIESFPFNTSKGKWSQDEQGRIEFLAPVDQGVIFNLKSHLAFSLKKDVQEDMSIYITTKEFDKKKYLWRGEFDNKGLRKQFESDFLSRMENRYENVPKKPLEVKGNSVYIKDVFDDARFIDSVIRYKTWLEGMYLGVDSSINHRVKLFKDMIVESIGQSTGVIIYGFMCASPSNRKEASILIPIMQNCRGARLLTKEEAGNINRAFNYTVLNDLDGRTQAELSTNGSSEVYGIDFSNPYISHCVITKIIESSVINKDHELAIDPERALSPVQSPLNSPVHPGQSGQRTPPKQRQEDRDSGYDSNSPPKPKDSGASSSDPRSSFEEIQEPQSCFPRQVHHHLGAAEVSAAKNVQAGPSTWSQQPNRWSLPAPSVWSLSQSGPSGLSWKGATKNVPAGTSAWSQQPNRWSLPAPSVWSLSQSGPSSWKGAQAGANISEKEEKLIEALLYTLNLTNYTYGGVYTNFFVKDGKIVSLLHDNVDREKYFQAVEEYCEGEEEARGLCDLNEFPFKLNYEEKKGKTVVANISSGALSNLKILFSQKFGKNVDAIDISVVKKVEKREKNEGVDRQLKDSLEEACEGCFSDEEAIEEACQDCFPDEGAMKKIPIAFEEGKYVLDRSGDTCEVELLFREQLRRFRGTSLEKRKSSDKPLTEEEKNLFKELLYAFNYSNNNFDLPDTNFIVKNGKIASLIPDSVDVKEYLEEVKKKTKEEYCKDKKEAYDLDEFPFEFLSNCEKNQETTVVANISRGALFNLKKLFIYGYKKKAETGDIDIKIGDIDINTVEEAVKSKKYELVNSKVKGIEREGGYYDRIKHCEAVTACYPDENALEDIPIGKYKAGYRLNHTRGPWETESLLEELKYAKDKSKAKKMKSEDNKDSGISSGEATDAENVSSKAEAITSSGYESMDCENTRGGSPKRSGEEVVQAFKKQCIISTQIEDVTSESFGQRQGSIVG